jgi:DNA topoisomerase-1
MQIKRTTINKKFEYDTKDALLIKYAESLVIPPAYDNVIIYKPPASNLKKYKISYTGVDAKGRTQYIYADWWTKQQGQKKFADLAEFGRSFPKIMSTVDSLIKQKKLTKNKLIALVLKIITICNFRVGNEKYSNLYKSHGISTITANHCSFIKNTMVIKFIGKKAVLNECVIMDAVVIREMKTIIKNLKPLDKVFALKNDSPLKATEINNWLKKYNTKFTSKMFRIYSTNIMLLNRMRESNPKTIKSKNARKKLVVQWLKEVSCIVHNTPAICKKDYSDVRILQMYIDQPIKWNSIFGQSNSTQVAFTRFQESN